jgi:hypothetical protein
LVIADTNKDCVREVNTSGTIETVAGIPDENSYTRDGFPATDTAFGPVQGVAVDSLGNIYISDGGNNLVRMVDHSTGNVSTVVGSASGGYSGDGGPAIDAMVNVPMGLALDPTNNSLYVADSQNNVVREAVAADVSLAASPSASYSGENVTFTASVSASFLGGSAMPIAGEVDFYDGWDFLGTASLDSGTATFTTSSLAAATHTITADYYGDTAAVTEPVLYLTSTSLTTSSPSADEGNTVTLTATVSATDGGGTPTGAVEFLDGSNVIGFSPLNGSGIALLTTDYLAVGTHSLLAVYEGSSVFYKRVPRLQRAGGGLAP